MGNERMSYPIYRSAAALTLLIGTAHMPARATTFFPQSFTCPVGGERFESPVMASNSTFGQRPDGKPYSPMPVAPIVECPGNGLLLYQEKFSNEEVRKVKPLIASADYQAMRARETQYYRLWWLRKQMGDTPEDLAFTLLVASWETDGDAPRKARYQQAFVDAVRELGTGTPARDRFRLDLRAANALRELGAFDAAGQMLDRLAAEAASVEDADERSASSRLIDGLRALVAEKVTVSEPVNLIPDDLAIFPCVVRRATLAPVEQRVCDTPAIRAKIAETSTTTDDDRELSGEAAVRYLARETTQPTG